ncbi:MAG: hypothetical protein AAB884_00320 [Patescibacteria group bacterium]
MKPDQSFVKKSRSLILGERNRRVFALPQFALPRFAFAWSGAFVVIFLVFALGFLPQFLRKPSFSSLNASNLNQEFKNLSINIELRELSYQQTVSQAIASALTEISDNQTPHLSPSLLEAEKNGVNLEEFSDPQINELLDQIIF